jgi:S-adenosylmethionine/arginine decarboxylase-like enzyme
MEIIEPWGYHLILDVAGCIPTAIRQRTIIETFAKTLVKKIDMVAYGEPQIYHFGSDDKMGYTLVQLIETSNITAHFVEENDTAYIDVFSCKPFDKTVVVDVVKSFFNPKRIKLHYMERRA